MNFYETEETSTIKKILAYHIIMSQAFVSENQYHETFDKFLIQNLAYTSLIHLGTLHAFVKEIVH